EEGAFAGRETIVGEGRVVAVHETLDKESLLDGAHGAADALVRGGEEADERHEEEARVHLLRAVRLHERSDGGVERLLADLLMQLPAQRAPALDGAIELAELRAADGAVERDPDHDLGVREVLRVAAHLPDAVIGSEAEALEVRDERALEVPRVLALRHVAAPSLVQGVDHLAEHVELEL